MIKHNIKMSGWWYKNMKGRIFYIKHDKSSHLYFVVNEEEWRGSVIDKKHCKIIS